MDLQRLTFLPTSLTEASDARLNAFAFDHLQRLTQANTDGSHTALIAALKDAYEGCFGTMVDEDVAISQREGLTKAVSDALAALKNAIPDSEAAVRLAFGKNSATYKEFFPQGLTEYRRTTLTTASALFTRFVDRAKAHESRLGAAFVTKHEELLATYLRAHATQRQGKGAVSDLKAASRAQRTTLERQLWKNALLLAANHIGDDKALGVYFDTSTITRTRTAKPKEGQIVV